MQAAHYYGRVVGCSPPFEDMALRLAEVGDPEVLTTFLATRLAGLASGDRAQATMTAAWLTELYLDQINRALLEVGRGAITSVGLVLSCCQACLAALMVALLAGLPEAGKLGGAAMYSFGLPYVVGLLQISLWAESKE